MTNQADLKRIKEIGDALPKTLKHPSGKYRIKITDKMRKEYGEAYLKAEREKNE
jgi:hypothetical protein